MENDKVLAEARRLHALGFGIHWLHSKSKRPIESGWTTGPRKSWAYLEKSYRKGMNVGVRLGEVSKIDGAFLGVVDVDVKSKSERHAKEVEEKLAAMLKGSTLPIVQSGRGNGSRHYYILTERPIDPHKAAQSLETVKVSMPSVKPSKRELAMLTHAELASGIRLRPAWEIAFMGEGQQVVLPPSIHPDSGKPYLWQAAFTPALASGFDESIVHKAVDNPNTIDALVVVSEDQPGKRGPKTLEGFEVVPVDLSWLPISDKIRQMILTGEGVEDRSAMLLPVSAALLKSGLSQNEVLSVLTDPDNYLGQTAYHHAKTKDRQRAAAWLYKYTFKKAHAEQDAERLFSEPAQTPRELSVEEQAEQVAVFEELWSWRSMLELSKYDNYLASLKNVVLILENEVAPDVVRRDTFAYRDFYSKDTPWGGMVNASLTDDDSTRIKHWLSQNFGFEPSVNTINEALTIVATNNGFDPIVDWLRSLEPWDGTERLDGWLKKYFGAKGDADYLAQVFRKWVVAMVMRGLKPGSKFDWMPIFEGAQGVGKSSFGRLLCGDKHFLDWLPDLANKDSALALQGIWSVEMGELASFRKNEIETVKAFITRTVDKVRPPYGKKWLEVPRRCVFFGTTNFDTYLRDESGNRRFKPIKVGRLNFQALERDRNQLFAEALWLYDNGWETEKTLDVDGEAKIYEAAIQGDKMVADESSLMAEALAGFFAKKEENFDPNRFRIVDLFDCGPRPFLGPAPLANWKYDSRNVQFAAKALKALGSANFKSNGLRYFKFTN